MLPDTVGMALPWQSPRHREQGHSGTASRGCESLTGVRRVSLPAWLEEPVPHQRGGNGDKS